MTVILRQDDFDSSIMDMWSELVIAAVEKNILPKDIDVSTVEEISVEVTGAFLK